jgi:two-component system, NtrC family, sensor kinase
VLRGAGRVAGEADTASLLGPKRLLAIDDSPTYLNGLADALRGEGYDVVLARSGEEALDLLSVQSVDCILLDLMMPGLSGQDTCRRIKAAPHVRDTPLIMLTAIEDRNAVLEGLGSGADDFISKSNDLDVLKARVRAQIRRRQFEDENQHIREQLLHRELEAAEARAAREVAEARATLVEELERKNKELEAFSYSVSHDLRAPLRAIDGFSKLVLNEYGTALDERGQHYLKRIRAGTARMGVLVDDLLSLSRISTTPLHQAPVDLTALAREVLRELAARDTARSVETVVAEGATAVGDAGQVRIALENLLGNAWKFTQKREHARIEFGQLRADAETAFFVRDNGAGFEMAYAGKLFEPFQRLHDSSEFEGTGIGLATVQRIVSRHGGRAWAESEVGRGATFYFTLAHPREATLAA